VLPDRLDELLGDGRDVGATGVEDHAGLLNLVPLRWGFGTGAKDGRDQSCSLTGGGDRLAVLVRFRDEMESVSMLPQRLDTLASARNVDRVVENRAGRQKRFVDRDLRFLRALDGSEVA